MEDSRDVIEFVSIDEARSFGHVIGDCPKPAAVDAAYELLPVRLPYYDIRLVG
jgi:hypothetical protein